MSYNLFLDDIRVPGTAFNYMKDPRYNNLEWVIVRNFREFVAVIEKRGIPELVSYDHDLADIHYSMGVESFSYHEETGLECAKYLISQLQGNKHPTYIIHSANPVGAKRILNAIKDYERTRS
jgi:hypothetical protein